MWIFTRIIIFLVVSTLLVGSVFWVEVRRPPKNEIQEGADSCIKNQTSNSEKFTCPVGDFGDTDGQSLGRQKIECSIQVAIMFYEIDREADRWLKWLTTSRDPNFESWQDEMKKKINNEWGFQDKYLAVCDNLRNDIQNFTTKSPDDYRCAKTSDAFPYGTCHDIAEKKVQALKTAGWIFASQGVAKWFQNGKDVFLDQQKNVYSKLLDKWDWYRRIVQNAVYKFTCYIQQAVK